MNRLILANIIRLKKSKLFWGLTAACSLIAIAMTLNLLDYNKKPTVDGILFVYPVLVGMAIAIFVSIFIGTEYGDGAIRNKVTVGHRRESIYFANLITVILAAFIMIIAYLLPVIVLGFSIFGLPGMGGAAFIKLFLVSLLTIISYCSLHTMISMIYANKAGATVVNLVVAFVLFLIVFALIGMLAVPEFEHIYGIGGSETELVPNPNYVSGFKRWLFQAIVNLLPMGQATQFAGGISGQLWQLALCSLGVIAACTAVGIVVFERKNLK